MYGHQGTKGSTMTSTIDMTALQELLGRAVVDLGAVPTAGLVCLGERLGLFSALAGGPHTTAELAQATGSDERQVREWSRALAAGGYLTLEGEDVLSLSPEQAAVLCPGGVLDLPAAFDMMLACGGALDRLEESFRTGSGIPWGEHDERVHHGVARFFRSGYEQNLVAEWLPAVDGLVDRLTAGARVLDVATGYGVVPILLAEAFPQTEVHGVDGHGPSVEAARAAAREAGLDGRVHLGTTDAGELPAGPFDLVTTCDALHDMGDPAAAARAVRSVLADDGVWLVVEPMAGSTVAENLHPVGRLYYGGSTMICVPHARSEGGAALGAQAGEEAVRTVAAEAGFGRFRRAAETPFNTVYEIRP